MLLGDTGVGKSSLCMQFVSNHFEPYRESTVGASFLTKTIVSDNTAIKFNIWDTAGQEKYHSFAPLYMRGASAAMIVYDVTRRQTFENVAHWITDLRDTTDRDVVIAIAGNKMDLPLESHEVSADEARAYAEREGCLFAETSAKTAQNVAPLFHEITLRLPALHSSQDNVGRLVVSLNQPAHHYGEDPAPSSGPCC